LPNDGINFEDRSLGKFNNISFQRKKTTTWNSIGATVSVEDGDLIIFPSWVPHSVNRNETKNKERISLSFNTFPVGELGDYYRLTRLNL
jgi:ectoine hydroxylase-related dioxygenase (phytanoyl-CoA dioxygenase family)